MPVVSCAKTSNPLSTLALHLSNFRTEVSNPLVLAVIDLDTSEVSLPCGGEDDAIVGACTGSEDVAPPLPALSVGTG